MPGLLARAFVVTSFALLAGCEVHAMRPALAVDAPVIDRTIVGASSSEDVAQLALADERTCARMLDGTVRCWGLVSEGREQILPTPMPSIVDAVDLAVADDHACVLLADRTIRCWGGNDFGALGKSADETHGDPYALVDPGLVDVSEVAVGSGFSCARRADGSAWCWGRNTHGELADGTTDDRPAPNVAPSIAGVGALALANDRGFAVDRGALLVFGGGFPVAIPFALAPSSEDPPVVVEVAASSTHACARTLDGHVWCWGSNEHGELGDGTTDDRATPARVYGVSRAVQIAVGRGTTCARLADGTARCWGRNDFGQLGDATILDRPNPIVVSGLYHVKQIAIAATHACALLEDATVECWGSDASGELGDRARKFRGVRGRVLF